MKKNHNSKAPDAANDLWVNPRANIKGPDGNRGRERGGNVSSSAGARFLELADIALGVKKAVPKKRRAAASHTHHVTSRPSLRHKSAT